VGGQSKRNGGKNMPRKGDGHIPVSQERNVCTMAYVAREKAEQAYALSRAFCETEERERAAA